MSLGVIAKEVYIKLPSGDPNLLGSDFSCAGSSSGETYYPIGRGDFAGSQIRYTTFDGNKEKLEDRSSDPMRGCVNFVNGRCQKGSYYCPVSSVVNVEDFRLRLQALRKLEKLPVNSK